MHCGALEGSPGRQSCNSGSFKTRLESEKCENALLGASVSFWPAEGLLYEYEWRLHVIEYLMMFRAQDLIIRDQKIKFMTSSQLYRNYKSKTRRQVVTIDVL